MSRRMSAISVHALGSPLGELLAALREGRLVALGLPGRGRQEFAAAVARRLSGHEVFFWEGAEPPGSPAAELARQLGLYFARLRARIPFPVSLVGTPFQRRVWAELARIPFGERRTYAELGSLLGNPALARAVGGACAANPVPILIPCHRVVASGGGLGGYSGGLEVKRLLLDLEAARPAADKRRGSVPRSPSVTA
jgi:methylated-DNA-[protein]-cysteine S-methyltransferase